MCGCITAYMIALLLSCPLLAHCVDNQNSSVAERLCSTLPDKVQMTHCMYDKCLPVVCTCIPHTPWLQQIPNSDRVPAVFCSLFSLVYVYISIMYMLHT